MHPALLLLLLLTAPTETRFSIKKLKKCYTVPEALKMEVKNKTKAPLYFSIAIEMQEQGKWTLLDADIFTSEGEKVLIKPCPPATKQRYSFRTDEIPSDILESHQLFRFALIQYSGTSQTLYTQSFKVANCGKR